MARDGSGNWQPPSGPPVVNGTTISSTAHNALVTDIGVALTASIAKDGQTTAAADLPMGTYKHTGVGDATARNMYGAVGQIQDGDFSVLSSVSGTNTITGSLTPAITAYSAGMIVVLIPANTNTDAATIAISGLTALDILKVNNAALVAGDLVAGIPAVLVLDSGADDWILVNPMTLSGVNLALSGTLSVTGAVTLNGALTTDNTTADEAGFKGLPQNAQTGNYTLVLTDAGKHIHHASGAGAGDTYTIPANASVPFPVGTAITFTNNDSNAVSIAITSDSLILAGTTATGTRTLSQNGEATALKVAATVWFISGPGLS
jgi:hypothetical protein